MFESVPLGNGGDGTSEFVVEFVDGVDIDIGRRGAHTAVGDVGAADRDDAASQIAPLEFSTDLDEVRLDLVPTERASRTVTILSVAERRLAATRCTEPPQEAFQRLSDGSSVVCRQDATGR